MSGSSHVSGPGAGRRRRSNPPAALDTATAGTTGSSPRPRPTRPSSPGGPPTWTAGCVASSRPRWPAVQRRVWPSSRWAGTAGASCARPATSTCCCCTTAGATSPTSRSGSGTGVGRGGEARPRCGPPARPSPSPPTTSTPPRRCSRWTLAGDPQLADGLATGATAAWEKRGRRWLRRLADSVEARHRQAAEVAFHLEPDLKSGRGGLRRARPALGQPGPSGAARRRPGHARRGLRPVAGGARAAPPDPSRLRRPDAPGAGRRGRRAGTDADALHGRPRRGRPLDRMALGRDLVPSAVVARRPRLGVHPHRLPWATGWCSAIARCTCSPTPIRPRTRRSSSARGRGGDPGHPDRPGVPRPPRRAGRRDADPWPAGALDAFVELLSAGPAIGVIEALDQLGLWVRILPEWELRRGPRNAYHRFTVDRHLCEAAANAAGLTDRVSRPGPARAGVATTSARPGDHTEVGWTSSPASGPRLGLPPEDVDVP